MQEDFEYDALTSRAVTSRAPQRTRWHTRLWPACLGHGCFGRKQQQFTLYLIGYDPVGQLHRAASVGDVASVERLINGGDYHVNECDRRGRSSLHYACAHNQPDVVTFLVSNNCTNINLQDDEGCTPLIKATQRDNVECVSILLMKGADPHIIDFNGDAALHHAVCRGNKTIVGKLLQHKANIDSKTEYGLTAYKLALYEKQHEMAEFLIKNGADTHLELKPNRLSENPDVPASIREDKGSTSAMKVEETKPERVRPAPYEDGIVPKPTAHTNQMQSSCASPPGPPLVPSICTINGPGGTPGPRRIPPPKPPRTKRLLPPKPPLSSPLPPRDISPGPARSISPSLPNCMPPGPTHQFEETRTECILPAPYEEGTVTQPTAHTNLMSTSSAIERADALQATEKILLQDTAVDHPCASGPPGPPLVPSICTINGPGGTPGPRRIPPPKPPRTKRLLPPKPPLSSPLPPRDISPGPARPISPSLPNCMPPGPTHQFEETRTECILPAPYEEGTVTQPTAHTNLMSTSSAIERADALQATEKILLQDTAVDHPCASGPPGPPLVPSICTINGPGGTPGPRRIPPPKPPRTKRLLPPKPPLSSPLPPRDISPGPARPISPSLPNCMPPGPTHQFEETRTECILPAPYEEGTVTQPTAHTNLMSTSSAIERADALQATEKILLQDTAVDHPCASGPPGPPLVPSICTINGPGGTPGPRRIPPPKPPRTKRLLPPKPPLSSPLPPRDISPGPARPISPSLPNCMPPGPTHQFEETRTECILPAPYEEGTVTQPTAHTNLMSTSSAIERADALQATEKILLQDTAVDHPCASGPPGPPLVPSICTINGPGGTPGPRRIPPPKPPRTKRLLPPKPPLSSPLPPRDISPGPARPISPSLPNCMPPGPTHQFEETRTECILPAPYEEGTVTQPTAHTNLMSTSSAIERADALQATEKILLQDTAVDHPCASGDALDPPHKATECFSARNPADYTHRVMSSHSKFKPHWAATMSLLMLTTAISFLNFVAMLMMWVFNLI